MPQECYRADIVNECNGDNHEDDVGSDTGTLIAEEDGIEICTNVHYDDVSTPLTTCKKKRKVRRKRSEAAKKSRRISNKMPLKPKMDKLSDLPALIDAGVETSYGEETYHSTHKSDCERDGTCSSNSREQCVQEG